MFDFANEDILLIVFVICVDRNVNSWMPILHYKYIGNFLFALVPPFHLLAPAPQISPISHCVSLCQ